MSERRFARPAVLKAIPRDRSAVIEASAGTGKTFTLEHIVVDLLLNTDAALEQILVVTFTEKATHELRQRLRAKLEELRYGEGEAWSPASSVGPQGDANDCWVVDDAARAKLERALSSFDAASITTIHAFCQRVLRENAFASGRLFDEEQVDGRDAFGRAMRDALRRDVACDERQSGWLEAALRTGWSIARIEGLLWDCLQSRGELKPTLNVVAIHAALDAFPVEDARSPGVLAQMRSWGMHATTARTVASRLHTLADVVEGLRAGRNIMSYVNQAQDLRFDYLLEKLPQKPPARGPGARLCAAARGLARTTPTFASSLAQAILPPVVAELGRRKREAGQYDFDDMLALVDEALRGPRGEPLSKAMRERWRHVLIDESQDTDETQWSIFRRGFLEPPGQSALCLVGDPKQSIYRFRGADVHTYLRARDEIQSAGGARVTLDRNYRATPPLVAACNALFDQGASTPIFTGSLEHLPVTCGRPQRTLIDGEGRPVTPVHVMRFSGSADTRALSALADRFAREIRNITDPLRPWTLEGRALELSDIFVLSRTAREGRTLGAALRASQLPYAFYKQDGLFQTDEAREVHTLLLAIDDPSDRARRLAAWLTPFFGLSLTAVERARDLPSAHPLVARLRAWKVFADLRDFDAMFESIIEDSGVVRREIFFSDGERELTNYQQIIELLVEHAHGTHATLRDLVDALSGLIGGTRLPLDLEGSVQRLESERRAVQIMTIHKSKGLEAPIVFVAGGFSHGRADDVHVYHQDGRRHAWVGAIGDPEVGGRVKAEEHEEEQRLMYVALTRAMGRLYLPCAVHDDTSGRGSARSGDSRPLRGPYGIINRRIAELLPTGDPLFSVEDLVIGATEGPPVAFRESQGGSMPPPKLPRGELDEKYATLRRQRAGTFVTSYTRMRGERAAAPPAWRSAPTQVPDVPATALRSARTTGIFLHDLLERIPLVTFGGCSGFDEWRSRPDVAASIGDAIAAHRIDPAEREDAERLVWSAFTTPFHVSGGERVGGIAAATRVVREMEFVFPVSQSGEKAASPLRRIRGYVRGSIDVAFDHGGRTYFVDWKSDSLASYAPESLDHYVLEHYAKQAQLYAVAILKLLGVETIEQYEARFGGMIYCFLRGFEASGRGLWSARPTWQSASSWETALAEASYGAGGRT